ncbi:MAG: c-type cytochrome [Microcoleaceae cyanobacterium]
MDKPLASFDISLLIQRIALSAVTFMAIILTWVIGSNWLQGSDPYVENVLSLEGDPLQGQAIFLMNCAGCHISQQGAQVGPSLQDVSQRKSRVRIIQQVTSGKTPPMPQFQPGYQEMADLLSYLEQI